MAQSPGADAALQIRAATIGETEQFLEVFSAAFRLNRDAARPLFYRDPFFDLKLKRICLDAGNIVSCLTIVPCRLRVGAGIVPMAGIAGVATRPESRRRGYAGALLTDTIHKSSELGFPISGLFPAEPLYYAKFGWTHASSASTWTMRRDALPTLTSGMKPEAKWPSAVEESSSQPSNGCVRPMAPSHPIDVAEVARLHDTVTRERTGACYRGTMRWRVIHEMMAHRETYVVDVDGRIDGYVHIETDTQRHVIVIHEMHASTKSAASSLVAFLSTLDGDTIEWTADAVDVEYFGLSDVATAAVDPDAMLRITDVRAALSAVHKDVYAPAFEGGGRKSLTLIVRDAINPANEVPVTIDAHGVRPGADGTLAVATDISTLTRLFVGYNSATEARDGGSFYASDDRSLALAEKLFPKRDPQIPALDKF